MGRIEWAKLSKFANYIRLGWLAWRGEAAYFNFIDVVLRGCCRTLWAINFWASNTPAQYFQTISKGAFILNNKPVECEGMGLNGWKSNDLKKKYSGKKKKMDSLHSLRLGTEKGQRKFWEQHISMICLCSKYVKNCNIFGQILNIWVKLLLKKISNFFNV